MKPVTSFLIAFLFAIILISCSKSNNSSALLIGKWNLVSDYSYLEGNATFTGGESNYIGKPNDYFYFERDGNLYVKKGSEQDTGTYTFPKEGEVEFVYFTLGDVRFSGNGAIRGAYIISNFLSYSNTYVF